MFAIVPSDAGSGSSSSSSYELLLYENCYFVYGGDTCDRCDGDIRIFRGKIGVIWVILYYTYAYYDNASDFMIIILI